MRWYVQFGSRAALLEKIAERTGETPRALADRATPIPYALPYFVAFKTLHGSRIIRHDGSPGAIPVSEIAAYADLMGITGREDKQDLLRFVSVCDRTYLEVSGEHGSE